MGRPRGKSKKAIEATSNDDEDGSGGEEVPPTPRRRGRRPQKLVKDDDADEAEHKDTAEVDAADATKPAVVRPGKDSKKRRRRRLKQSSGESVEEDDEEGHVRAKSNGFRPNGSRRKSTPRRAAEAGVECK
ncbi:hypothetical protein HU200_061771 [Digitaria exilis]|uniref:Uncharacterized protein n=1 Tax=Digitaria exilis TaxID=1010633 RepID=A0A835A8E0_9POAL|nr:hypothetical protein HU200_061771 [Digitaria exilis]